MRNIDEGRERERKKSMRIELIVEGREEEEEFDLYWKLISDWFESKK